MPNPQPKDYAIVVGIDDYPLYGTNGRNLSGAVRDATRFHTWLLDSEVGGGLQPEHCHLITSHGDPMALTQAAIDLKFRDLWTKARNAEGGRRFYFYFAGHGQLILSQNTLDIEQSLCLPQWSPDMPNAALNADSYPKVVRKCMPFEEIVMFLDCCRAPAIQVVALPSTVGCIAFNTDYDQVNTMVYYAAEPMRLAFEGDIGDAAEEEEIEVQGFFSTALIEALEMGSDRDGGGIGAEALWNYLKLRVPQIADVSGRRQSPRRGSFQFSDNVVFGSASPQAENGESNFEIRFSDERTGPIRLVDSGAGVLRDGPPASGPWQVHLNPGETYMLIDDNNDQQRAFVFLPGMEGKHDTF